MPGATCKYSIKLTCAYFLALSLACPMWLSTRSTFLNLILSGGPETSVDDSRWNLVPPFLQKVSPSASMPAFTVHTDALRAVLDVVAHDHEDDGLRRRVLVRQPALASLSHVDLKRKALHFTLLPSNVLRRLALKSTQPSTVVSSIGT